MWELNFTKRAIKDAQILADAGLNKKAEHLIAIVQNNPFQSSPPFEKLVGDLEGAYFRRINILHRPVYQVLEKEKQ